MTASYFHIIRVFITLVALFAYLNQHFLELRMPIGVMVLALGDLLAWQRQHQLRV